MAEDSLRDFVAEAGQRLNKGPEEVEPYVKILEDNWFDSPESLIDVKPEELANQGIPLRFAKELVAAAAQGPTPRKPAKGKGKGKADGKGHQAVAVRPREAEWSASGAGSSGGGQHTQRIDLWDAEPGFNLRGAVIGERGRNMHHIQDQTGARVWVSGDKGEPLCVEITAGSAKDTAKAAVLVKDLLGAVREEHENWRRQQQQQQQGRWAHEPPSKGSHWAEKGEKGEKGKGKGKDGKGKAFGKGKAGKDGAFREVLELWAVEPGFNLKGKIIGDHGRNVHHIQDQTGARLWVSDDTGNLEISADTSDGLRRAVQLARDLLRSIEEEYGEWLGDAGGAPRKGGSKGKHKGGSKDGGGKDSGKGKRDGGKGEGSFEKWIPLDATDPAFRFKHELIGEGGRNVRHIKNESGAALWVHGEPGNEMQLCVSADTPGKLDSAVKMAKDLIKTVYGMYDEWLKEENSRGRRRDYDDREHGAKRSRTS